MNKRPLLIACLLSFCAGPVCAQWITQTIQLKPGWNAVFLEVQPEPRTSSALFANLPVESVWFYNRRFSTVQFIDDLNKLVPNQPDWLTYLPSTHPLAARSRLFSIEGGRPYLIKIREDAAPFTWTVRGLAIVRIPSWLADSYNFVGFPLVAGTATSMQSFMANAAALGTNVYRLDPAGMWVQVKNAAGTLMPQGEAFWLRTAGPCDFPGTVSVQLERRAGLDFGELLAEQVLQIRNNSTGPATITLRQLTSEPPSSAQSPALAGPVPLSYWKTNVGNAVMGWAELSSPITQSNLPAGGVWEVRLAVRRKDMVTYTPPAGVSNVLYQSILEVSDGTGRILAPVTAVGLEGANVQSMMKQRRKDAPPAQRVGLWVGSVAIDKVTQPAVDPATPVSTASGFEFRLIVHLDASGQARLLQKVLQRWLNGTTKPAGGGSTNLVVDVPGRYVLLTDERLAAQPQFSGAGLRDGQEVGRRFSSAAFTFQRPLLMSGTGEFGAGGSVYSALVTVAHDDPLSPFVHTYHPDHDNLKDARKVALTVYTNSVGTYTAESYTVKRAIELRFEAEDSASFAGLAGWGDVRLGGTYRETIYGLHQTPLIIEGKFQLFKSSPTAVLDQ